MNQPFCDDGYVQKLAHAAIEHDPDAACRAMLLKMEEMILNAGGAASATLMTCYLMLCALDPEYTPLDAATLLQAVSGRAA